MNKNLIPIAIIIAGFLIAGAVIYTNYQNQEGPGGVTSEILSPQDAANKLINFINKNILRGETTASLIEVLEENGLYKVKFNVEDQEVEWQMSKDGKLVFPQVIDLTKTEEAAEETGKAIGNFSISSNEVCKENEKPIIYFFGSQGCPHCKWEHPIIEEVAARFGEEIAFHNNMDSEADENIFQKYSTGGIPTLVLGCKYFRVGSGESTGQEAEEKNLTALICKLTDGKPGGVCSQVQDLINQIK